MAWLHGDNAVQQLGENVILYDLTQIRGINPLLSRIPENMSGVYAWYRCFNLNPDARSDPKIFVSSVLDELYKPLFASRETHLPPSTKLILQAETRFSKEQDLQKFAYDSSFRELVFTLLENSLLFQQPLYIGKATNLQQRIRAHLYLGSILRERLALANHDIDKCKLLIIGTTSSEALSSSKSESELDDYFDEELSDLESDRLTEDILSRLFLPSFSINYG